MKKSTIFVIMKQKKVQLSVLILLLLFVFNYASNNFFLHTHIVDDVKVVHSHPYGTEGETHQHSKASFDLISHTARLAYILLFLVAVPVAILSLKYIIVNYVEIIREKYLIIRRIPRAPPI